MVNPALQIKAKGWHDKMNTLFLHNCSTSRKYLYFPCRRFFLEQSLKYIFFSVHIGLNMLLHSLYKLQEKITTYLTAKGCTMYSSLVASFVFDICCWADSMLHGLRFYCGLKKWNRQKIFINNSDRIVITLLRNTH